MKKYLTIALAAMALSLFATPNTAHAGFWDHFKWHHKKQTQTNEGTPTRSGNEATTSTQGQGSMGGSQSGSSGSTYGGSSSSPQSSGQGSGSSSGSSSGGPMGGTSSGGSTQY